LGIAIICAMLWLGYEIYRTPQLGLSVPTSPPSPGTGKGGSPPNPAPIGVHHGVELFLLVLRFGILALGVLVGSLIAMRGTRLISAA
jgi:hypothetical protein